jgi:stage II sporulation protein AA (anti-sigma F factor antagonist)
MKVLEETTGPVGIISLTGRLDALAAPEFDRQFVSSPLSHQNLLVDCSAVEFLSSAGLRVLLQLCKKLQAAGGVLYLCCPSPNVKEVLEISGMAAFLPIFDTREQALEALAQRPDAAPAG